MSVEEARGKLLMRVSHEIELDEDAVDDLILEVQAAMPCSTCLAIHDGRAEEEWTCQTAAWIRDETDYCPSCQARAKLKVEVPA